MSSPESKVVSLATAKALKEAGFPQETERCWQRIQFCEEETWRLQEEIERTGEPSVAAPDAQEIAGLLPKGFVSGKATEEGYFCRKEAGGKSMDCFGLGPNMAEACAEVWLYLKQQKLI